MCVIEARIWHFRIDIPPSQSRSRQDVSLSSPSDACQELKSSKAGPDTSHTLSKHDTSRVFIGQPRVPTRLKNPFDLNVLQVSTTALQASKASCDAAMC